MKRISACRPIYPRKQAGVVLIIALVVLVAMTLAAVSLIRSVDMATQISGNLAYRQSGIQAADGVAEDARVALMAMGTDQLDTDQTASFYYATWDGGVKNKPFDPFTWPSWDSSKEKQYVIHRMCENKGKPTDSGTNCFTAPVVISGKSNTIGPIATPDTLSNNPYYRVTVRVKGAKNTVTYTQVVLY